MNYFITQDWSSTHGNHAGMTHLCNLIKSKYKYEVCHIVVPDFNIKYTRPIYHLIYLYIAIMMCFKVKEHDRVYLMEYLDPARRQDFVSRLLRKFSKARIIGLVHFVPEDLDCFFKQDETIIEWCSHVDAIMTLGSSLTCYLKQRGVACPINTAFHYVDHDYYSPNLRSYNNRLKALFMGSMKRDYQSLEKIVKECPNVDFIFLKGNSKKDTSYLNKYKNLQVYDYVVEDQLREIMNMSHISLNIMYDTIGSNVITTSLAMGMAMLVSDVGSVRDYCNESNAIFCKNIDDFVEALNHLTFDQVQEMSKNATCVSMKLSFEKFYNLILRY